MERKAVRCSSLPRVMACPASLVEPKVHIDIENVNSRLGSAVHELLAALVRGEEHDLRVIADKWNVDVDALAPLYHVGRRRWGDYADLFQVHAVEKRMFVPGTEVELSGTPDVVAHVIDSDTLVIVDFKSGLPSRTHIEQLRGYGFLARLRWISNPNSTVKFFTFWLRSGDVDIQDITQTELMDWWANLPARLSHTDHYSPSPEACEFCPRQYECPARAHLVEQSITDLTPADGIKALSPAGLASLYPKAQMLARALDDYKTTLKAAIQERGALPIDETREIVLEERKRQMLEPKATIAMLQSIGIDASAALMVHKAKACKLVGETAKRGEKGKAIDGFLNVLREQGAITISSYQSLTVQKAQKKEAE